MYVSKQNLPKLYVYKEAFTSAHQMRFAKYDIYKYLKKWLPDECVR